MHKPLDRHAAHSAVIWQGFRHAWSYNHRLNRFGSYVVQAGESSPNGACAVHTAASGTGGDTAEVMEVVTEVTDAAGVSFLAGVTETQLECQRGDPHPFVIRVDDLALPPEMQHAEIITVIINGFDLVATEHAEKLMTMDLEITDPVLTRQGTAVRFRILGQMCFDCRSPECQLLPFRIAIEKDKPAPVDEHARPMITTPSETPPVVRRKQRGLDRHRIDRAAHWLKQRIVTITDVEGIKRSVVGDEGDIMRRQLFRAFGRRVLFKFLKWRFSAPYTLRVHYLLIAGDKDALHVSESADIEHGYDWDMDREVDAQAGALPVEVTGDNAAAYDVNALAFRRVLTEVQIDEEQGSEDPIQWGKGMHLLDWNLAIAGSDPTATGVKATLDLFYKNWSVAMNEVLTLTTWGAVRAAGRVRLGARLALLQFRQAGGGDQQRIPGHITWPGGGLSAETDPRAFAVRPVDPDGEARR